MSLAAFGRKIRAAASILIPAREARIRELNEADVALTPEPPPLPEFGTCPTCGQSLPALAEEGREPR